MPGQPNPAGYADAAAEAIRELNHATVRGGYLYPSDVAATLTSLGVAVARLPQALDQAARWLLAEAAAGRVGHDGHHHTQGAETAATMTTVTTLTMAALNASDAARQVAEALSRASAQASRLTGIDTNGGG